MNIWSDVQYCTGFKSAHPGTVQSQRVAQPLHSYLCVSVMYLSLGTKIIDSFPKNKSLFSKKNNSSILLSCKAIKHQFWSPVASRVWRKTADNLLRGIQWCWEALNVGWKHLLHWVGILVSDPGIFTCASGRLCQRKRLVTFMIFLCFLSLHPPRFC